MRTKDAGPQVTPLTAEPAPPPGLIGLAEAFAAEALFGSLTRGRVVEATRSAAEELSLPALDAALLLQRLVARDPLFLRVEPDSAIEAQLRALLVFAPLGHASLWLGNGSAPPLCAAAAGVQRPLRPVRVAAARALTSGAAGAAIRDGHLIRTVPVRVEDGRGALVLLTRRGKTRAGVAHAAETAVALAPILERRRLLEGALHSTAQMLAAVERRVTRFGFDLHDGPLQRLSLLAGELTLLNRQLALLVSDDAARAVAERRVADLTDLAADVASELRDLARLASGRAIEPLTAQLQRTVRDFEARSGIRAELSVEGEVDRTTDSQRIAVARVVEEALSNVAAHSRATRVSVAVRRDAETVVLTIADDGRGFGVARSEKAAARLGRLGLSSMRERVRMLGGRLEVSSRRGGPTVVTAELPAWDAPSEASRRARP